MNLTQEVQRYVFAAVGAGHLAGSTIKELVRDPASYVERADDLYRRLAERGESVVARGRGEVRRERDEAVRTARKVPGVAAVEGEVRGLAGSAEDLPISGYESLTATQITARLPELSQRELHQVEGFEGRNQARVTVLQKIDDLRGEEPWSGYDEMTVEDIVPKLRELDTDELTEVLAHERKHKNRSTVLQAAERAQN